MRRYHLSLSNVMLSKAHLRLGDCTDKVPKSVVFPPNAPKLGGRFETSRLIFSTCGLISKVSHQIGMIYLPVETAENAESFPAKSLLIPAFFARSDLHCKYPIGHFLLAPDRIR